MPRYSIGQMEAFNALPAAISPDWWSHTYVTQTNQPWSRNLTGQPYFNVNSYGNTFGLEPNFPCCTVNHGQGYPKYVASSYIRTGEYQVVHALLGPTTLQATLHGATVKISCKTSYPFSGHLEYTIEKKSAFEFPVRVPDWAATGSNSIFHGNTAVLTPTEGLQTFSISPGITKVEMNLDMQLNTSERNGSTAVYYGPLLYALDIEQAASFHSPLNFSDTKPLLADEVSPHTHDYVIEPASPWNFAIDPTSLEVEHVTSSDPKHLANPIWTRGAPPIVIWANAYPVEWPEELGTAGLPPQDPVVVGNATRVKLIPFGAAKLHIADFPTVKV
ncbi:hypothetical protein BU16DRAFT_528454 [Lophium mytilinum]|uniref:Non-reducing end beta-L-arabinofuranosidase-like GH127 middle domain-containing protein n=1 Tax=Lophium mytilinum TaxID=390894 RepID=A0A6A6QLA7_9PEZI|nr:hypothetical protein BU16DRAFT_528454 [Lophium mytilinum]